MNYNKLITVGSITALIGFVLSGPFSVLLISFVKPQPIWVSSAVFAENYSAIQNLPYYFGFLLIGGMLMLVAGHYLNYKEDNSKKKFLLLVALGWTIAFCTLISFNYICQTTFVHNLALHYKPEYDSAIYIFSMSNPMSLCWAIEMWGYALLGISTLFMSGYYQSKNNFIRLLLIINGIGSLLGAIWIIIDVSWVMTVIGIICYVVWNVLMIMIITSIYRYSRETA